MLRPIPTVSHLVPRYWTDLVTSQVLAPNERRLQVTSPSGHEGLGWMSETVDSDFGLEWKAPNSKKQGFLVRFYILFLPHCFIWKVLVQEFGWKHSPSRVGDSMRMWVHKGMCSSIFLPTQHLYPKSEKSILIWVNSNSLPNRRKVNRFERDSLPQITSI